jgi:hypothetical protein
VLVGVLASIVKDIGSHKLLAARSAVAGIVIYLLSSFPVNWLVHFLASHEWLRIESRLRIADLLGDLACIIIGWAVFTLSTRRQFTKVCLYSVAVFLFEAVHVSSGLVLDGRLSRVTSQILLLGVVLSITRPLSILVGNTCFRHNQAPLGRDISSDHDHRVTAPNCPSDCFSPNVVRDSKAF